MDDHRITPAAQGGHCLPQCQTSSDYKPCMLLKLTRFQGYAVSRLTRSRDTFGFYFGCPIVSVTDTRLLDIPGMYVLSDESRIVQ